MSTEPTARRPYMPGYGIAGPEEGTGLLPWSWAEDRLVRSHDFWLATQWPDGRPHVMPVWGVWADGALWFSASPQSRKARNLAEHPRATATTDNPLEPVIVEGDASRVAADSQIVGFAERVNSKYASDYSVDFFRANATYRLDPACAFGLAEADFIGSPTRWSFG